MAIGAKDKLDRALVKQYATAQANNVNTVKINPDDMMDKINMMAIYYRIHSNLKKTMNISQPMVPLKGFWDK